MMHKTFSHQHKGVGKKMGELWRLATNGSILRQRKARPDGRGTARSAVGAGRRRSASLKAIFDLGKPARNLVPRYHSNVELAARLFAQKDTEKNTETNHWN
jgi:hypothetical protein